MGKQLTVLLVEDDDTDAQLVMRVLSKAGYEVQYTRVETEADLREALRSGDWDIVICDFKLPELDGPTALDILRSTDLDLPFIAVSGTMGEETAVAMMRAGSHDYVMKSNLPRLVPAIERELANAEIRRERRLAHQALQESEARYRLLADNAADVIWTLNTSSGKFTYVSPSVLRLRGFTPEEVLQQPVNDSLTPESLESVNRLISERLPEFLAQGKPLWFVDEVDQPHKDGRVIHTEATTTYVFNNRGEVEVVGVSRDITERKKYEAALRDYNTRLEADVEIRTRELRDSQEKLVQHERLAVLGRLATGVAHELRNPLSVINDAVYYIKHFTPGLSEKAREYLGIIEEEIKAAVQIIEDLTDYSKHRLAERQFTTVGGLAAQALQRVRVPESIQVTLDLPDDLPRVYVDVLQIEQVFSKLILNACQAMPEGGQLTIRAGQAVEDGQAGGPVGPLQVQICDTGRGISAENMPRLFSPLFTTKARGLGLSLALSK
ncbi:MAG: PAS domain S-box protein, partial [Chloroflexota bacterium]